MSTRRTAMMRYMRDKRQMTLREIGDEFGISRERVRQIIGNTGRRKGKAELHQNIDELRKAVFLDESKTHAQIAKRYHVSESTVRSALGARWRYLLSLGLRKCYRCGEIKPTDQFGINRTRFKTMTISGICKRCNNEQACYYYQIKKSKQGRAAKRSQKTAA